MELLLVFGKHFGELNPVSHLRVARDNCAQRKQSPINLEIHLENGPDGKWEDAFDVAAAFTEIGD